VIVAIDESGDFRVGSVGVWAAVFIRPSALEAISAAHVAWERDARRALGVSNELKGSQLDDEWASAFVRRVMSGSGGSPIEYRCVAVEVSSANFAAMAVQREVFGEGYDSWAETLETDGKPGASRRANAVRNLAAWVRALSDHQALKLMTLSHFVPTCVEWAIGRSCAARFDDELGDLAVWIDSGYIPRSQISAWREVLRNAFINTTHDRPIVYLDSWTADHPFLQRFVEVPRGTGLILKPAFKEMIEFRESSSTVAVRIADVVASVVRRSQLLEEPFGAYALLRAHCLHPESFTLIEWTQDRRPPRPNPYLM
jgi:hypothetical protein